MQESELVKRNDETAVQYFTSFGQEHCHEGMFNLVKQSDNVWMQTATTWKNKHCYVVFLDLKIFCNNDVDAIW
jgi:hypothetical protein